MVSTKKTLHYYWIAFLIIEVALVIFSLTGRLPGLFNYFIAAYLAGILIALSLLPALFLFLASIPLFLAVPLPGVPNFSSWRILILILIVKFIWRYRNNISIKWLNWRNLFKKLPPELLWGVGFIGFGFLFSLVVPGVHLFITVKKVIYLASAAMLGVIVGVLSRRKLAAHKYFVIALGSAVLLSDLGALGQYLFAMIAPLHTFWQWWVSHVSLPYYGAKLASVLQESNTWFSYYSDSLPTLRLFSIFPDSHSFALFGVLGIALLVGLAWQVWVKRRLGALISIGIWLFIHLVFIIMSGSRGIWLASTIPLLVSLVILGILYGNRQGLLRKILMPVKDSLISVMPFVLFLPLFLIAGILSSLTQDYAVFKSVGAEAGVDQAKPIYLERFKSVADFQEVSNKGRLMIWRESLGAIIERGLFGGVGLGNFPLVLDFEPESSKIGVSAHNLYLEVMVEVGLLGLILFLGFFGALLWRGYIYFKNFTSFTVWEKGFIIAFLLSILWLMVYGLFDVVLLNDRVLLLFMALVGLFYGMKRYPDKTEKKVSVSRTI